MAIKIEPMGAITIADAADLAGWLVAQAGRHGLAFLLAHADDGVIWGRFDPAADPAAPPGLRTSAGLAPSLPALRPETLQQCRAFGPAAEVLLWRGAGAWQARLVIDDDPGQRSKILEETQILWGTIGQVEDGFTIAEDGQQGLRHAVPIEVPNNHFVSDRDQNTADGRELYRPLRLVVHHILDHDPATGAAFIALSRLVRVESVARGGSA